MRNRTRATTESVETDYGGHHFRSRLEARWAVFLDAANIRFEYEPHILANRRRSIVYLPDFLLPDLGVYAEVKGFCSQPMLDRLLSIARSSARDLVVMGHIPGPFSSHFPTHLRRTETGGLIALPWNLGGPLRENRALTEEHITARLLIEGFPVVPPAEAELPLQTARQIRFGPGKPKDHCDLYG